MTPFGPVVAALLLAVTTLPTGSPSAAGDSSDGPLAYPETPREDTVEEIHGTPVADPYRWLEDGTSAEVQAWASEQDALAREHLGGLSGREHLAGRLRELFYSESVSIPQREGSRDFYTRRGPDQEKAVLFWRDGTGGREHVLLDPNTLSDDGSTSLGVWRPSPDGTNLAYTLRENNADEATLYVMDVTSGTVSDVDRIEGAKYASPSWTPEGDGFYYVGLPTDPSIPAAERLGHAEARFHVLGTDPAGDAVVRAATGDPETFVWTYVSRDGHWLFYGSSTFARDEIRFRDRRDPSSPWRTLVAGIDAHFWVDTWGDRFYVHTDHGASRGRLYLVDPAAPDRAGWHPLVPEASDAVLEQVSVVGGHLALTYRRHAATEIEILTLAGEPVRTLPLPALGSSGGLVGRPDRDEAWFRFSSFTTPPEIYRTSIRSGETQRWWRSEVPVDPSPYTVEQVFATSRDGTQVPVFVVRRKDLPRDGSTPFLLEGYGGFGVSMDPAFNSSIYPWLEAGGGYALAVLRGGGEYGEDWHRAGSRGNKQNVFDDFLAAAEHLVHTGYTSPARLAVRGGSNGGLLMGAALTQRPDLFAAVVCQVPLLDMVRYHLFGSGPTWVSEYGSAERAEDFNWLYAYSPYHHVEASTAYPAVLFASADSDDRVDPLHARKMAAALQAASTGGPVLLRIAANAGHGGAGVVHSHVAEYTDVYAFLFEHLGVAPPG